MKLISWCEKWHLWCYNLKCLDVGILLWRMWEKRTELNLVKKLWFALNFEVKFMLKSAFKIRWGWCKWMSSLWCKWRAHWRESGLKLGLSGAWSCNLSPWSQDRIAPARALVMLELCPAAISILCGTVPSPALLTASIMSSRHHCGQSHVPHQDRFETKAFVRHQVLLLPSDTECFMPGKHPPWPLVVAKGIWGCWGSLPGTWPRTTAGGMDVPGAWLCFPWGFGNRCSDGYLLSSISCALCDGCLWNSSLQVLWCGYCNMPWTFTVKNLLENLGICIYPL